MPCPYGLTGNQGPQKKLDKKGRVVYFYAIKEDFLKGKEFFQEEGLRRKWANLQG
jgi:hypothetical protein